MWAAALALVLAAGPLFGAGPPASPAQLREKALALNELTGTKPMFGTLLALVDDKDGTKQLLAVAAKMIKEKPQPFNRNASYLLARAAEHLKDVEASAAFYRLNALLNVKLMSERGVANAYLGLIQMYSDNKKFAESEKACKEVLGIEGDEQGDLEEIKPQVMSRLVLVIAKQGDHKRALRLADELVKADQRNWMNLALKAQVLREADRLEEAAKAYADVIEKVKKETRIKETARDEYLDDYRYLLSGLYTDMGQIDKATEVLKTLLARDPSNPGYNNDLGYLWADKGVNLAEAEKLIRKAIDEDRKLRKSNPQVRKDGDRDNAAYLDSLGWVLFKQGKAKEAKPYLLDAAKDKEGQSIEIYDHLGDVHLQLGEKTEAVAAWKKGVEAASSSKRDQKRKAEVLKKLKKHDKKDE